MGLLPQVRDRKPLIKLKVDTPPLGTTTRAIRNRFNHLACGGTHLAVGHTWRPGGTHSRFPDEPASRSFRDALQLRSAITVR